MNGHWCYFSLWVDNPDCALTWNYIGFEEILVGSCFSLSCSNISKYGNWNSNQSIGCCPSAIRLKKVDFGSSIRRFSDCIITFLCRYIILAQTQYKFVWQWERAHLSAFVQMARLSTSVLSTIVIKFA